MDASENGKPAVDFDECFKWYQWKTKVNYATGQRDSDYAVKMIDGNNLSSSASMLWRMVHDSRTNLRNTLNRAAPHPT
jgi:hypothetical protein